MSKEKNIEKKLTLKNVFNQKTIKKGVFYFVSITIITLTALFIYNNSGKTLEAWKQLDIKLIIIGFLFIGADLLLGGWRNHIFAREFVPGISQWVSFRANLANIFMGAVTPSQTGGGIAQWYVFYKNGISIQECITMSFVNFISTLLFFPLSGLGAYYVLQGAIPDGFITQLAKFGLGVFGTLFTIIIIFLIFPKAIGHLIQAISKVVSKINPKWKEKLTRFGEKSMDTMIDYQFKVKDLLIRKPQLMLYSLLITILLYFNKYALTYIFVKAFNLDIDFWSATSIQAVNYLLLYFAPTPGGSGIAEFSMDALLRGFVSGDYSSSITFLHRTFLVYIPALIGSYVVIRELGKKKVETAPEA